MLIPYGTVVAYGGEIFEKEKKMPLPDFSRTPLNTTGWLLCDGKEILRSMFPHLVAVIRDIYGGDFNSGKVKLPDYQGYFLRGLATNKDQDPGFGERKAAPNGKADSVGSSQECMVQKHSHNYINYPPEGASLPIVSDGPQANPDQFTTGLFDDNKQPLSGTETRPKNQYVYYIIYAGLPQK